MFSDELKKIVECKFPENWIKNYTYPKREGLKRKELEKDFNEILPLCIELFYTSLLTGEYANEENFHQKLEDVKNFINSNFDEIGKDEKAQKILVELVKEKFIDVLILFFEIYQNFLKLINIKNQNPNLDIFLSHLSKDSFWDIEDKETINKLFFFSIIIHLYKLDHFFEDDDSFFESILDIENMLIKHFQEKKFFPIVKEKVHFLKFKWEINQKSYNRNRTGLTKAYVVDSKLFITTGKIQSLKTTKPELLKWKEHIESFYEFDDWENNLENKINNDIFKTENNEVLYLLEKLKFYKDVKPNYLNLVEVVKEFKALYINNQNTPDKYTYNKLYVYALNNQFSLLLDQKDLDESRVNDLKNEIEQIQNKCNINNFFTEFKFLNFKLKQFKNKYENRPEFEVYIEEKNELDKIGESVFSYHKKLEWSKKNFNLLYQLPYNESLVKSSVDGNDIYIYYASSSVLPLPKTGSENDFISIKNNYERLNTQVSSLTNLKKEFNKIEELKEDFKSSEIRTIELIGIFTAVVAFVLSSIPSFTFVKDFYQAFLFIIIIGSTLLLMIAFIFLFTRGFLIKRTRWMIGLSTILLVFAITLLSVSTKKNHYNTIELFDNKMDSVTIYYQKVNENRTDSIELYYQNKAKTSTITNEHQSVNDTSLTQTTLHNQK